ALALLLDEPALHGADLGELRGRAIGHGFALIIRSTTFSSSFAIPACVRARGQAELRLDVGAQCEPGHGRLGRQPLALLERYAHADHLPAPLRPRSLVTLLCGDL